MALPLPKEYPCYVAYAPVDAEYPCITYSHDGSDNKFVGLARGTQVYSFTSWAETLTECEIVSAALEKALVGYSEKDVVKTTYVENRESGFTNGLYYKRTFLRVVLVGTYGR